MPPLQHERILTLTIIEDGDRRMDYATARIASHAWQVQPRGLRRGVVELARNGHPTPDRTVRRLAVDWGLSQDQLEHGRMVGAILIIALMGLVRAFDKNYQGATDLAWLLLQVVLLAFVWGNRYRHRDAAYAAAANLPALLAEGAYPPRERLEVRAIGRPRWLVVGYTAVYALLLAYFLGAITEPDSWTSKAWITAILAVLGGIYFLIHHRRQRRANLRRRPRTGTPVVTIDRTGLRLHQLGQIVAWSRLVNAGLTPVEDSSFPSLTVTFTASDPALTVAFETQWLDQHPGVILASARFFMANHAGQPAIHNGPVG